VVIQNHISDAYEIPWNRVRVNEYGNAGYIPNVWADGKYQFVGSQYYEFYRGWYSYCQTEPTDVSIQLAAAPVSGQTFKFKARVSLDLIGQAKSVRVYLLRVLDHYPPLGYHCVNCTMEVAAEQDIDLTPGQRVVVEREMTFDGVSWNQQSDIRFVAIAQKPRPLGYVGPMEVYNAKMATWPFMPSWTGDLNCDGAINNFDIDPFVLALTNENGYKSQYPNCNRLLADVNNDGLVDNFDIDPFVRLLTAP
jgi:hypothetical protein